MADPRYLGQNDVGLNVWEIEEGGMRPLIVDNGSGEIVCQHCQDSRVPERITLSMEMVERIEWAILSCPECKWTHCIMRVKLLGEGLIHADCGGVMPRPKRKRGKRSNKEKVKAGMTAAVREHNALIMEAVEQTEKDRASQALADAERRVEEEQGTDA